jgi:hypothetical protein
MYRIAGNHLRSLKVPPRPAILGAFGDEPLRVAARRTGWLVWRTDGCCVRPIYVFAVWLIGLFRDWSATRTVDYSIASIPIRNGRLLLLCPYWRCVQRLVAVHFACKTFASFGVSVRLSFAWLIMLGMFRR